MRLKQCKKCKQELPLDKFYKSKYTKDGYRSYCKECDKENNRDYYLKHRKDLIQKQKEYTNNNREKVRNYQNQYSNLHKEDRKIYYKDLADDKRSLLNSLKYPCVKCGEERPWVIAFHHINPENKSFTISDKYRGSIELIVNEVKKCVCLCHNCHAEFHWIFGMNPENPEEALREYINNNFVLINNQLVKCMVE